MSEKKMMKYSVLRYSPSRVAGEHINLGIIFDAPKDNYLEFRYVRKYARLAAFDDELNIDNVKTLLRNIKEDISGNIFIGNTFDIEDYVKFYINDFCFEKPKTIAYDDVKEVIDTLHRSYFRFEYEKHERPTAEEDKKMLARIIKDSGKIVSKQRVLNGLFDDRITYDLVTDDYKIKVFDYDKKDLSRSINAAKTWAWNAMKNKDHKVMFIYRYDDADDSHSDAFNTIISILNDSGADVVDIDTGISKLQA